MNEKSHHVTSIDTADRSVDLDSVGANLSAKPEQMGFNIAIPGPDARVHIGLQMDSGYISSTQFHPPHASVSKCT